MGAKFPTVGKVTNMEREDTKMYPILLNWNWRYMYELMWTHMREREREIYTHTKLYFLAPYAEIT